MATPDFPAWAGGFQLHFQKVQSATQGSLHQLEVLAASWIPSHLLAPQDEKEFSRQRIWTLRLTFWSFLWQVAQVGASCRKTVRQAIFLCAAQAQPLPGDDDGPYCVARAKLPVERLDQIHRHLVQDAQGLVRQADLWIDKRVRVLDGTCFTMPDTQENQTRFPQPSSQKPGCGFPVARILACFCLATGMVLHWVSGHWYQHELSLLPELLENFGPGDVLLGDRGFGNFPVLAQCLARGLDGVFRANTAKRRLDLRQGQRLGKDDRMVVWDKGPKPKYMSAEYWDQLPAQIQLRVVRVQARVPGFRTRSVLLVSTLLDPLKYPPAQLARLYLRRWEMEICFRHLKTTLQMDVLSCKTPAMIDRELRMHFLVHNLVRRVALEAARRHRAPLPRISFAGTVGAIHSFAEACLQVRSRNQREHMRAQLYKLLAEDLVPERTGRREPRAVKRRPKPYPFLTAPRSCYIEIQHRNRYRRPQATPLPQELK